MKEPKDLPPDFTDLQRRAEELIAAEAIPPEELSPDQAARLIHELRVHQVELEMQNDELRRSQAELEDSRSKYADLYDFAPVGYLTLDARDKIVEANLTAVTLLGVERSKLLNRFFTHFLVEADRRVFRQLMNNGLNQTERRGEVHLQDGGGNVRVMLLDILFLTDAEGQERRRVSLTDITELKRTQEELRLHKEDLEELVTQRTAELIETNGQLREANDKLQALFEAAPLAIVEFDAGGKVTKINQACERIYGWTLEEIEGRPIRTPPEESLALLQRVLSGESIAGMEIKQQRKDGTFLDASVSGAPLYDAQGKIRGFVGLAEDITERKKLEEAVRTQALVLSSMAEGVSVTDQRGEIVYTNPAFDAMFGYGPGELVGRHSNILNFSPPDKHQSIIKKIMDQVNTTGLWRGEFHNCKKDGNPFFTMAHISTVTVGGKKLYVSVQEDITQKKRTQEMLLRQAELLDLAHDAIMVRDTKGRITYWNQGAAKHYGWSTDEALGQIFHKLLQTVFPEPLKEIESHLLEHGFWEGELTQTTQQGSKLVMNSRWTVKRNKAGRVVAILEIGQDVTVQKQIEQEVHRLASFPLLNPNPVLEVDEDGQITYANPAARHTAEKLRLRKGMKAFVPPDLKEKFAAVRQGGPRQYTFDLSFKERAYAVSLSFPHDLPTARLYALDITEREQTKKALEESLSLYQATQESTADGLLAVDLRGRMISWNRKFMDMWRMPEHLLDARDEEKGLAHILDQLVDPQGFLTKVRELYAHPEVEDFDVIHFRDSRVFERYSLPQYLGNRAVGRVWSFRDVTDRVKAEQALRESEERYRNLVELSPDAILVFTEGKYVFANQAAARLFKAASPADLVGQDVVSLVPPDYRDFVERRIQEVLAGDLENQQEAKILRLDGQPVAIEATAQAIRYQNQPAILILMRDITDRQKAEQILRESREDLNRAQAVAHTGSWRINVQKNELTWSEETHRIFGIPPGTPMTYETFLGAVHTEDRKFVDQRWTAALRGEPYDIEHRIVVEGTVKWVRERAELEFDPEGQLLGGFGTIQDITARKQVEAALRDSEERFRLAFENANIGMALVSLNGSYLQVNQALSDMFGYSREELEHMKVSDLTDPADLPENRNFWQRALRGELGSAQFEKKKVHKNGTIVWVHIASSLVRDSQGAPLYFVSQVQDITDRKRMEEELRYSNQRLDLLAETAGRLLAADSPQEVVESLCLQVMDFLKCDVFFNFLVVPDREEPLHLNACAGISEEDAGRLEWLDFGLGVCGCEARDARPIVCSDILTTDDPRTELVKSYGIQAYACHPLMVGGRVLGALSFGTRQRTGFAPDELALIRAVADQVAIAMSRKMSEEALRRAHDELELRVDERTAALRLANEQLLLEIEARQQAEDKLRESEARFAAFMEHLPGLAVMRDMQGSYLFANPAWERMMGLELGAWQEKNLAELWPPEQATAFQRLDFQVISTGFPTELVERMEQADGTHYYLTHRFPILDQNGLPYMVGTVAIDITARRQAEEALKEHAALVHDLYNSAPCGYHSLDPEGTFVQINDTELAWLGYTREEVVGSLKLTDVLTPESVRLFQENFPGFKERGWVKDLEYDLVRKDGTVFPVNLSATAITDQFGNYLMSRSTIFDITERKQAEKALVAERQRLFDLLENLPAIIYLQAPDYSVRFANRRFRERFGEHNGGTCHTLMWGKDKPCPDCPTFSVFHTGESKEWELTGPDDRTYQIYDYPFPDVDGSPLVLEMAIDITDRKKTESALQESEKKLRYLADQLLTAQENERKRLAAELHDELGHALLALKLHLSSIEKKLPPEQEMVKAEIRSQLDYINEVIQEVRRLYHDLSPGDVEDLGLTKALRTLINDFAAHFPQITWQVDLADLEGLFSQPVQTIIYRLVQEALTNIGKHANPKHVTVTTSQEGSQVYFAVQDDGTGFDVEKVMGAPGRGMGLAATEERLRMVGGSFNIQSGEKEGTRFSFTIPALPE